MFTVADRNGSLAIVSGRLGLLLPSDVSAARTDALWSMMSSTEDVVFEDVLTGLIRQGLARLPDFALVELTAPGTATVAVRGRASVVSVGSRAHRILGNEVDTWVETTLTDVSTLRLTMHEDDEVSEERHPVVSGVVRTRDLAWGVPPWFDVATPTDEVTVPEVLESEDPEPETPEELTMMSRRVRRFGHESIDGHTVLRTPKRVATWLLRFESGQVIGVGGRVVIGRKPRPTEGTAHGVEQLEQLLSLRREVSANHALLIPEEQGVRVVDLHSTNGTIIRPKDGSSVLLTNGAEHVLKPGERVNFGDDNVAVCERAPLHNPTA